MLTIFFRCHCKPGVEPAMEQLVLRMTALSRAEPGCISYRFHQNQDDPCAWMLYEQWQDQAALKSHQDHMYAHFGQPPQGRRLPAAMDELVESFSGRFYRVVE